MYVAMFRHLVSTRARAIVTIVGWVLIAGVLAGLAPTLKSVEDNRSASLPPAAADSTQARELTRSVFPDQQGTPAVIAVTGIDRADTESAVARISATLSGSARPDGVLGVVSPTLTPGAGAELVSADGGTALVVVPIEGSPADVEFRDTVDAVRVLAAAEAGDAQVAVTGPAGIAADTVKVFAGGDRVLLLGTVLLVLMILLVIYRSPLLALAPLLAVGLAMRIAQSLGALMADAGWFEISAQTASIMTVLLFGVGTDYALIITARYREALIDEPDRYRAMGVAVRGVGETVLSSASTIVLAMLALLVSISPALRGFGPYLALGVAVMAVVAFTFLPAVVLLFGARVFWPVTLPTAAARARGGVVWHRAADLVAKSPVKVAAGGLVVLAVMSLGLLGYRQTFDSVAGFRVDTESARGLDQMRAGFGPGEVAPTTVLVTGASDLRGSDAVARVADALAALDSVARVGEAPRLSADGHTAAITVVLDGDPYGARALDAVGPLHATAQAAAEAAGVPKASVLVGGETAQTADIRAALDRDMGYLVPVVLLVVGAVLMLLLGSVLAPLYLVATLVLSFLATMGVTTFVTVTLLGDDGIGNRVTAYVFVFLVALGVDYTIFVMSRFRQETRFAPPAEAIRTAVIRTGGVVSSAGLILAATFSVLMTQPIRELFQFGFAMAVGILLDTFVVRPLIVPAVVRLLGGKALWPRRLTPPHPRVAMARPTVEEPA